MTRVSEPGAEFGDSSLGDASSVSANSEPLRDNAVRSAFGGAQALVDLQSLRSKEQSDSQKQGDQLSAAEGLTGLQGLKDKLTDKRKEKDGDGSDKDGKKQDGKGILDRLKDRVGGGQGDRPVLDFLKKNLPEGMKMLEGMNLGDVLSKDKLAGMLGALKDAPALYDNVKSLFNTLKGMGKPEVSLTPGGNIGVKLKFDESKDFQVNKSEKHGPVEVTLSTVHMAKDVNFEINPKAALAQIQKAKEGGGDKKENAGLIIENAQGITFDIKMKTVLGETEKKGIGLSGATLDKDKDGKPVAKVEIDNPIVRGSKMTVSVPISFDTGKK